MNDRAFADLDAVAAAVFGGVQRAIRSIATHVAGGGQVAASCSAVFLLQAAGVLAGRQATTTWWLAPELARIASETTVTANRILCVDGPVITARLEGYSIGSDRYGRPVSLGERQFGAGGP